MPSHAGADQAGRIVELFTWTFPSVCLLSICNVMLNDAVFFAVRIVGRRLPNLVQRCARTTNEAVNLAVAVLGYLWIHSSCRPGIDACASNVLAEVECAKTVALALCTVFALSMCDRLSTVLLYPDHFSSFVSRMGEAGGVVIAWQLLGEREGLAPLFVALLVARRSRFALPRISKYTCASLRVAVAAIAVNALGKNCNTVTQKASVGILLSTVLLRSSCPLKRRLPVEEAAPAPTRAGPQSPPPRRRRRRIPIPTSMPTRRFTSTTIYARRAGAPTVSTACREPTTTTTKTGSTTAPLPRRHPQVRLPTAMKTIDPW
jgi:hypothetical protein